MGTLQDALATRPIVGDPPSATSLKRPCRGRAGCRARFSTERIFRASRSTRPACREPHEKVERLPRACASEQTRCRTPP